MNNLQLTVLRSATRKVRRLGVLGSLAFLVWSLQAQDVSVLSEMPSVEQVIADMKGTSRLDTAARAANAMRQLGAMIQMSSPQLSAEEAAKVAEYERARGAIEQEATAR